MLKKKDGKVNNPLKGFTLIELILVVAIVAVLAGLMIPVIRGAQEDAKIAKMLQLVEAYKTALILFHSDTGAFESEMANKFISRHGLWADLGTPGWNGPYIPTPLDYKDNPFYRPDLIMGDFGISQGLGSSPFLGPNFDLDGDGFNETFGDGASFGVSGVPLSAAQKINDIYDSGIGGNWRTSGRVRYSGPIIFITLRIFLAKG